MPQTARTVTKALSLLDEFLGGATELTLSEMTRRTGLNKTTTLRLCTSLEKSGLLERESRGGYRLGPKVEQLAQAYRQDFRLENALRPLLRQVRDATGESASFYIPEGRERVCRFRENSRFTIRHHLEEGTRLPLESGVVGRVLIAFSGRRGPRLEEIRRDGFLISQGREPHTTSVSVPVLDRRGTMAGAFVVSGPSVRFNGAALNRALALLQAAALKARDVLPNLSEAAQPQSHVNASRRPPKAA